jgi:tetratricopeptide (TPR) repeat protein
MGLLNIFGRNVNLDTLSLINKADEEIKRNNLQASIETLSKVIEIDKTNWNVYFKRGKSFQLLNKFDEAINDYLKGILLDDNDSLNRGLGECYIMKSDFHNGKKYFTKAFNLIEELESFDQVSLRDYKWDKANIMNNLAVAYYNLGNRQEAINCCKKGIDFESSYGGNYGILGSLCLEDNLFNEAINFFNIGASFGDERSKEILKDFT